MTKSRKTKAELLSELEALLARLADMEKRRNEYRKADELQRELHASERKYRSFVESFQGIAFRGGMDFIPEFIHGAVEEITGYTEEQFLRRQVKWDDLIHPEDFPKVWAGAEKMQVTPHSSLEREYRIRHKDGVVRWVYEHIQNICDDRGNFVAVQGVIHDITGRKLVEQALRASEARLDLAVTGSKAGVWDLEYSIHDPAGSVSCRIYISPEFKRFIGYEDAEFPNTLEAWRRHVIPEDLEKAIEAAGDLLAGLVDELEVEYRMRHKDGSLRWIHSRGRIRLDEGGRVIRWTGLNWDITERKKTEEELRRLVAILEQTPDFIATSDLEGNILYFNKAAREALGIRPDRGVSGLKISQFYPEWAMRILFEEVIPKVLEEGAWYGDNTALLTSGKEEIPVSQVVLSHKDSSGNIRYLSTIVRDITRIRKAESALRQSEERYRQLSQSLEAKVKEQVAKLRQAESMAAIGRMISVVAHEVRNPLSNITLGLDTLRESPGAGAEKMEVFAEIQYSVDILNRLVGELLDYSRPIQLEYTRRSVDALVKDALRRLPQISNRVTVRVELEQGDKDILADAEKIVRVLVNVISNAIDAMPGGGLLRITSSYSSFPNSLQICVSDTGIGIDEETLKKICAPFFTTKSRGTGLGLPICMKIIDLHHGNLRVTSKPNEGTTVEIVLPVAPAVDG